MRVSEEHVPILHGQVEGLDVGETRWEAPSWSALPLIRQCVSARVGYLARVSKLATNLPAFLNFDSKIDAAILSIAGVTPREAVSSFWLRIPTIRSLPLSLFGLGILRFAGLAGETACLLSREHAYDFFKQQYQRPVACHCNGST